MSKYIIEFSIAKGVAAIESIDDFRILLRENNPQIWSYQGDTSEPIDLKDFICIKNNDGVVLYTKEELENRVPRKENLERLIPKFTQEFGNAFKEIIKKHKKEQ